jgi:Short C-terminal domain
MTSSEQTSTDDDGTAPAGHSAGARSRLSKLAAGVANGAREYRESRPIATVDVGTGKLSQAFSGSRFALYADRLEVPKGTSGKTTHTLTPEVRAEVDSAGGYAKKIDRRELYLRITGNGWSVTRQCDKKRGDKVRRFADAVNAASQALPSEPVQDAVNLAVGPASDPVEAIKKLADLRDAGAITTEDFEAKKNELLDRM